MAKYVIGEVGEIPPGERKIVDVAGRTIGVFNIGGEFYALRNTCPHQGGPLCQGRLTGFVTSRMPGDYSYTRRGEILRCPWHGWEFDVKTGQSWWDPARTRVRAYPVSVVSMTQESNGETTVAEAAPAAASTAPEGLEKGPYVAESYDVTLEKQAEKQFIVVEIP